MGILNDKVAIVTGAGKGLGVAEAVELAKEGAAVTIVSRTYDEVARTAKTIEDLGGRALALQCDVSDQKQVEIMVKETVARFGAVDILVNNAHSKPGEHPFEEWTDEEMRITWETGPLASWYCMVACFPHMKEKGFGRIINFGSVAGHGHVPGWVGYSIAKEAIRSLTKTAAMEWGKYGITVNTISPCATSEFNTAVFGSLENQREALKAAGALILELPDPQEIGRAVVYLASPDARHITGCLLPVNSGCGI